MKSTKIANCSRVFEVDVTIFNISTFLSPRFILNTYQLVNKSVFQTVNTKETWNRIIRREVPGFDPNSHSSLSLKELKRKYFYLTCKRTIKCVNLVSKYNQNYHCTIKSVILDRPNKELGVSIDERGNMTLGHIQRPEYSSLFICRNFNEDLSGGTKYKYRYRHYFRRSGEDQERKEEYVMLKIKNEKCKFKIKDLKKHVEGVLVYELPEFKVGDLLIFQYGSGGYSQECILSFKKENVKKELLTPFLEEKEKKDNL